MPTTCVQGLAFLRDVIIESRDSLQNHKYDIMAEEEQDTNPTSGYFLGPAIDGAINNMNAMLELLSDNQEVICGTEQGMTVSDLLRKYRR